MAQISCLVLQEDININKVSVTTEEGWTQNNNEQYQPDMQK